MNEKDWVLIPNSIFPSTTNSNYLSPEEAYLFLLLYRWRIIHDNLFILNIDGISELSEYKFMAIKPNGDATRNKTKIRQLLHSLINKKYIFIDDELKNKKNNQLLYVGFYDIDHYHNFAKGHNQNISYKLFDQFTDPVEFYIYAYIDCFGDVGRTLSYEQWEFITKMKHDTIEKILKKMNTYKYKPRIWMFSGDYYENYGEIRQQENTYYTRPSEDIIKKWNGFYAKRDKKEWELAFGYRGKVKKVESLF